MQDNRFERTVSLIGQNSVDTLAECRIAVFGVGGVGSFVAEALARGGIGTIDLFDNDVVDITNINRQLIALESTVGRYKTDVMAERLKDINPNISVTSNKVFITPKTANEINFEKYDYVVDAVDNVTAKIAICANSREKNIPVISAMGAGNKLDPIAFEVADMEKTSVCPLARVMRYELKKRGITGVKALYSKEKPITPLCKENGNLKKLSPASISFVPSTAGLIIAGYVIKELIKLKGDSEL